MHECHAQRSALLPQKHAPHWATAWPWWVLAHFGAGGGPSPNRAPESFIRIFSMTNKPSDQSQAVAAAPKCPAAPYQPTAEERAALAKQRERTAEAIPVPRLHVEKQGD